MSLFRKKCEFCKEKIEKGQEIEKAVQVPGFVGTSKRAFCCSEHASNYEVEVAEHMKNGKTEGSCCG